MFPLTKKAKGAETMSEIQKRIMGFSDEFLLEQFRHKRDEYTEEAITLMEKEIKARNLTLEKTGDDGQDRADTELPDYSQEDVVPLDHAFFQVDLVMVRELFMEEKIPFVVDTQMSSSALPIESETTNYAKVHVPKSLLARASEKINEHFDTNNGVYAVKYTGIKDRLRSVSFYEINLSEEELHEKIEVTFSPDELKHIRTYITRLSKEAEALEQDPDRVLFYLDNLDECKRTVEKNNPTRFSRADLLSILEALQVYCGDEDFPQELDSTVEALLTFFSV